MKEKLTKEKIDSLTADLVNAKTMTETQNIWNAIWKAIESDREAVREEAREEVRKDHFRIGRMV